MQKCCQISKLCSLDFRPPSWKSDAILNLTKNVSSMEYAHSSSKLTEFGRKTSFSAILKIATILKTYDKNFLIFQDGDKNNFSTPAKSFWIFRNFFSVNQICVTYIWTDAMSKRE
jgi:hypothetical protein